MTYFDHNATTPLCPPARAAWLRVQDRLWHNASSLYREAAAARDELERCRERLAALLGDDEPESVVFTGGATEAHNAFFHGWSRSTAGRKQRAGTGGVAPSVYYSPYEHPSVREPARQICLGAALALGAERTGLPGDGAALVSWMAANNETGEVFDELVWDHGAGAILHRDAAQWFGKLPAATAGRWPAFLTGCAHKFGGPKGVGFLRLGGGSDDLQLLLGGPQENGRRGGTEDVAGVAAMVAALEWCEDQMPGDAGPRREFESALGWPVVAGDRPRLWNTSLVVAPRHDNRLWLARLSQRGFQCSTGSACSSGKDGDSHVLAAMGLRPDEMKRVLRFSSGWTTAPDDWRALLRAVKDVEKDLDAR